VPATRTPLPPPDSGWASSDRARTACAALRGFAPAATVCCRSRGTRGFRPPRAFGLRADRCSRFALADSGARFRHAKSPFLAASGALRLVRCPLGAAGPPAPPPSHGSGALSLPPAAAPDTVLWHSAGGAPPAGRASGGVQHGFRAAASMLPLPSPLSADLLRRILAPPTVPAHRSSVHWSGTAWATGRVAGQPWSAGPRTHGVGEASPLARSLTRRASARVRPHPVDRRAPAQQLLQEQLGFAWLPDGALPSPPHPPGPRRLNWLLAGWLGCGEPLPPDGALSPRPALL